MMETVKHKFKVEDRVIYRAVHTGNTELDGWVGTVVGIDTAEAPYTVRFDNALYDMATDERFWKKGQPRGHDWWCKEENLSPVGVRRRVVPSPAIVKKNARKAQEGEGIMRKNHEWVEAEDKLIREMLEDGEPLVAICDRIGVDLICLKNHLYALRKADPMFPRCQRTGRPGVINEDFDRAFEEDGEREEQAPPLPEEPKGGLNELEQAMAEQIKELKHELDTANAKNRELQEWSTALEADRDRYMAKVRELEETCDGLADEVAAEFEDGVAYYKGQIERLESTVHTQLSHIENLMGEKKLAEDEIARLRGVIVKLVERYVVG